MPTHESVTSAEPPHLLHTFEYALAFSTKDTSEYLSEQSRKERRRENCRSIENGDDDATTYEIQLKKMLRFPASRGNDQIGEED